MIINICDICLCPKIYLYHNTKSVCVNFTSRRILFNVQEKGTKFLSWKIFFKNDALRHYDCIFFWPASICGFSSVIVFSFEYCAVKFPIIPFVVIIRIIRNDIVARYVLVSETIIARLFQCNYGCYSDYSSLLIVLN